MREVFISYAHSDNELNAEITDEITNAVDHFLAVYRHVCEAPSDEGGGDLFFLDRTAIHSGQLIPDSVRAAIEECSVMLAFFSPRYFQSFHCLGEWKEFKRSQGLGKGSATQKLLIPIEVRTVDPSKIPQLDEAMPEWISELTGSTGLKHSVTSGMLLDRNTTRLASELVRLDERIQERILLRRGSSREMKTASNILTVQEKIERDSLKTTALAAELRDGSAKLKYDKLDPVCIVYAGGTHGELRLPERRRAWAYSRVQ